MNIIYPIVTFFIVYICYSHIINEYKVSEDLEVYEIDYQTNFLLQEACEIKQPLIFEKTTKIVFPSLESFKQTVEVKDLNDYNNTDNVTVDSLELPCSSFLQLIQNDLSSRYFSENNHLFIDESGISKIFQSLDNELKPNNTITTSHDILIASNGLCTPFRYHTDSRKFIYVVKGSVKIKMTSKKYTKYLNEVRDYENLEFRSRMNVWTSDTKIDKVQFIEFDIPCGSVIFIPSFWWYSIKYQESDTIMLECKYSNISNKIAFLPNSFRHYLQEYNIVRNFTRKIDIMKCNEIVEDTICTEEDTSELKIESKDIENVNV